MSSLARLLVIGLVASVVLAATAVTATFLADGGVATASPTASAHASQAATTQPTGGPSLDPADAFAEIEAQVLDLRGLPAPDIGPAEIIDRAQLATELEEMLAEEWTPAELRDANLSLRAMGLLTADQDLRELSQALLADQVIGFYDPTEKRMVVVSDEGLSVLARITYAHEYTHALQDESFSSFAEREALTDDDAILARQALEEGDATVVMFQWALQHLTPEELQQVTTTPQPDVSGVPGWMLRQLEFPYLAGLAFVTQLRATGDWAQINDAYTDAPVSTEQVLHPEKYLAGELPVELDPIEMSQALGDGWEELEPTTMGEAMIDIWLAELGVEQAAATEAAAGWGGDLLEVAVGPDGEWVMSWRIAFDSAADAAEFADAYQEASAPAGIATFMGEDSATSVIVAHASSEDLIPRLFGGG